MYVVIIILHVCVCVCVCVRVCVCDIDLIERIQSLKTIVSPLGERINTWESIAIYIYVVRSFYLDRSFYT